jgi:hypothetical protein
MAREALRIAIVTPYFSESRAVLERNIRSVKEQPHAATHILVADGQPHDWIDALDVTHIRLPTNAGDNGDTPRSVGIAYACSQNYDAITLLDADCYLVPTALETYVSFAGKHNVPLLVGRRYFARLDGTIMGLPDESVESHIDTNCYFFRRAAFHLLLRWALIPPPFHFIDDRVFREVVRSAGIPYAVVDKATVVFTTLYGNHYKYLGEEPPPNAKYAGAQGASAWQEWQSLEERVRRDYSDSLGFDVDELPFLRKSRVCRGR